MKAFRVDWDIELEAETAMEAAKEALKIHRDPDSIATVFIVTELKTGDSWQIDLTDRVILEYQKG